MPQARCTECGGVGHHEGSERLAWLDVEHEPRCEVRGLAFVEAAAGLFVDVQQDCSGSLVPAHEFYDRQRD